MTGFRYDNVQCSQCGANLGPGDHGVSYCSAHGGPGKVDTAAMRQNEADRRTVERAVALQADTSSAHLQRKAAEDRAALAEQHRDILLVELQAAHLIFPVLLAEMTSEQKFRLMRQGDLADMSPEGLTRYRERAAAIAQVTGSPA